MKLKITNCRVAFAHGLFKATAMEEGQQPKFGADFILGPEAKVFEVLADKKAVPTDMKKALLAVANETWKGKGAEMLEDLEASKKCYRNGNRRVNKSGDIYDGYEGHWYVTAKSPVRPGLFGAEGQPVTEEDGVIYSGCYVDVIFDLYGNAQPKKKGVFAGLTGVKFRADGDAFGGGRVATADDFEDISNGAKMGSLVD